MNTRGPVLTVAVLAGTVQVEFSGKTCVLSGGENRIFAEEVLSIGDFEKDLDGFEGAFQRDAAEAKVGKASAKLENKDKPWVEASKIFPGLRNDFLELRFWAKSPEAKTVTMRLADKAGQNYQQQFPIEPDGQWRRITVKEFNKGEAWAGPLPFMDASRGSLHPQVKNEKAVWAIQRWKSPLEGKVQVKGHFERDRQGDGCTVLILVDGKRVFEQHADGPRSLTRREFALDVGVRSGSLFDFAVTPGPENNLDFDNTMVDAQAVVKE